MHLFPFAFLLVYLVYHNNWVDGSQVLGGLVDDTFVYKWPSVAISVLVRNKAHSLPYFFSCLTSLDYPKHRIYLWIASDHNSDNSIEIIRDWVNEFGDHYNEVYMNLNDSSPPLYPDEDRVPVWAAARFLNVISLREHAIRFASKRWADYHLMLDADVFLTNPQVLTYLMQRDVMVVAPMLISDGLYSNFWGGVTDKYYYKRTELYTALVSGEKRGCFEVPMVHSAVLVNLRYRVTNYLSYDPNNLGQFTGPDDDIIIFATSCRQHGVKMHVCNDATYGYVQVPAEERAGAPHEPPPPPADQQQLLNVKLEALARGDVIPLIDVMAKWVQYPPPSKLGMSQIYMINLERRAQRRDLMMQSFRELGMDVKVFKAVDGSKLDLNNLQELNITLMPEYEDPYHKRPMKAGEIGCFLSHYHIWKEMVEMSYRRVMILEDDIHFAPYFHSKFQNLLHEISLIDWDIVYLGRKILLEGEEQLVTAHTTRPRYSYWTLGYLLSLRGARKLLAAQPLARMLPVDEFLPIMFDEHPNAEWKHQFGERSLVALSAAPLLLQPTHYTGQPGYVSDTEASPVLHAAPPHLADEL